MADPRFFTNKGPHKLGDLARLADAELGPNCEPERLIHDVAPLDSAGPDALSFLDNAKYVAAFRQSRAGACVVSAKLAGEAPAGMALLLSERPYRAYALIAQAFYSDAPATPAVVHPSAIVDADATVGLFDTPHVCPDWATVLTCSAIHTYVFSMPSRSGRDGFQPSCCWMRRLSEFLPLTPVGPGTLRISMSFPEMPLTM